MSRQIISEEAAKVLRILRDNEAGEYTVAELAKEARVSKTGVGRALRELEAAGIVAMMEEETC